MARGGNGTDGFDKYYERLEWLFRRSLNRIGREASLALDEGISPAQFLVLRFSLEKGGITVSELSELMGVTPSAVTSLCDRLVTAGLLERERGTEDRRIVVVRPSAAGQVKTEAMLARQKRITRRYLEQLTEAEQQQLLTLYERLVEVVESTPPEPEP